MPSTRQGKASSSKDNDMRRRSNDNRLERMSEDVRLIRGVGELKTAVTIEIKDLKRGVTSGVSC
jgi:hypothetical protein